MGWVLCNLGAHCHRKIPQRLVVVQLVNLLLQIATGVVLTWLQPRL